MGREEELMVERVEGAAAEVSWAGRRWRLGLRPGQAGHASLLGLRGARLRLDGLERAAVEELLGGEAGRRAAGRARPSWPTDWPPPAAWASPRPPRRPNGSC